MRKVFYSFIGVIILSCTAFTYANNTENTEIDERVQHAKQFLKVLNVGQELLKDSSSNSYYSFKINELQSQLQTKWKDSTKYPSVEELEKIELEVERLEQDLIVESVKIFAIPPYSSRRSYSMWKSWQSPHDIEFAKKKIKTAPPIEELVILQEDANLIMKNLGLGHVEAMSYRKYGIKKERLVRMRDGSVVGMEKDE